MLLINANRKAVRNVAIGGATLAVTYLLLSSDEMLARRRELADRLAFAKQADGKMDDDAARAGAFDRAADYLRKDIAFMDAHIVDVRGFGSSPDDPLEWRGEMSEGRRVCDLVLNTDHLRGALDAELWAASRGEPEKN